MKTPVKVSFCLLALLVAHSSGVVHAQTYLYNYQKAFDPSANSDIRSMDYTTDQGYAFAGWLQIPADSSSKTLLSKLNDSLPIAFGQSVDTTARSSV